MNRVRRFANARLFVLNNCAANGLEKERRVHESERRVVTSESNREEAVKKKKKGEKMRKLIEGVKRKRGVERKL